MPISPLPPLRPRATSATAPLAGLDITGDGWTSPVVSSPGHAALWGPLKSLVLAEGQQCHQHGGVYPWLPRATTSARPLESHQQLGRHGRRQGGVVLRGQPGLAQALCHPTPCPGWHRPWAPGRGWGSSVPLAGFASEHDGGVAQVFSASTCPWPALGEGSGGPWVGSRGLGWLFTATELVSFHLPRGKQLAIC